MMMNDDDDDDDDDDVDDVNQLMLYICQFTDRLTAGGTEWCSAGSHGTCHALLTFDWQIKDRVRVAAV